MGSIIVNTLKEKKIYNRSRNIRYEREDPSHLVLELKKYGGYIGVNLIARYKKDFRCCNLGNFYILACFESKEGIEKLMKKTEAKAEKFYSETLEMLIKGDYHLHLYDDGRMKLMVNGKPWKVPKISCSISS